MAKVTSIALSLHPPLRLILFTHLLASQAVVELVKAIHTWIKSTRPKVTMKVQVAQDKFVEINAENLPNMDEFVNQVLAKVNALEPGN